MEITTTTGQFFSLFFLFFGILTILIIVIFYSKWQIYGPKWHNFSTKVKSYFKNKFDKSKPKVQKGAVIENESLKEELEKKEKQAVSAQELLSIQNKKLQHQKEVQKMQIEINEKAKKKEGKTNEKKEQKDLKIEEKEFKKQAKKEKKAKKKKGK
ncbi:MAG: hypothetical protein HPAVJP_2630 [Candidatus Hepatoplasma vulgare]|nr:MAG: hypothetical protein HPAVJP_2630 [Candidatus Hepatoplasma sp.]